MVVKTLGSSMVLPVKNESSQNGHRPKKQDYVDVIFSDFGAGEI